MNGQSYAEGVKASNALKQMWHVSLVVANIKAGKTVCVVGPSGMDRAPYLAGLTAEEQSRLTFSELGGI